MKKISLFAVFLSHLIHADGFNDLKDLQSKFHEYIYRAGTELVPPAAKSAPEVAYISGLLRLPPVTLRDAEEANAIYMSLINKGASKNHSQQCSCDGLTPVLQPKCQAFNTCDFSGLERYHRYEASGHSVLGIAAQVQVNFTAGIVAAIPDSPPRGGRDGLAAMLAAKRIGLASSPQSGGAAGGAVAAAAPVMSAKEILLRDIPGKIAALKVSSKNYANDKHILERLQNRLSLPDAQMTPEIEEEITELTEFSEKLDSTDMKNSVRVGVLRNKYREQKVAVKDPVEQAIERCCMDKLLDRNIVPSEITDNKNAVEKAIRRIKALGDSATENQKNNLRTLNKRLPLIEDDGDSSEGEEEEDDTDDDVPPSPSVFKRKTVISPDTVIVAMSPVPAPASEGVAPIPMGARPVINPPVAVPAIDVPPPASVPAVVVSGVKQQQKGLSPQEKAQKKEEITQRIEQIEKQISDGALSRVKGNKAIAELRVEFAKLG